MAARQKGKEEVSHGEKTLLNPSFHNDLEDILKRLGASKPSSDVIAPLPRKMVHVWNLSTSRRAFLVVAFNADLYPFQPDVLSECVRYICSEADKLLEPSPETLDRKSTGNPFGVADTTPRPHQPEPQTSEGVIDENQAIWGQVALSFMTQQTTQLLTLREMLKDLRPIMERLGIRGKAWHDFEILFLCSNPEEAARTYDMIKKQLSSDRPSEIPSTRPP